ncbi:MAG: GNAT family N-acyltransferase [Rhodobacterales bacterium]
MTAAATKFSTKLAETRDEMLAAQKLRYRVFVEELGGTTDQTSAGRGVECDEYDAYYDHLILKDNTLPEAENVIGVYRLLRSGVKTSGPGFYSAGEFCLDKISSSGRKSVELGRSCVDARYRRGVAMHLLWNGLAEYVSRHNIQILFGVASFHGTDVQAISHGLSFLHHAYQAPEHQRVKAVGENAVAMDILPYDAIDKRKAVRQIPPLIKSYLRVGSMVGEGAYVDHGFNTIDVCLVMDTDQMSRKYRDFYLRDSAA